MNICQQIDDFLPFFAAGPIGASPEITNGCFALPADLFGVNGAGCFFGCFFGPNLRDNIAYNFGGSSYSPKACGKTA